MSLCKSFLNFFPSLFVLILVVWAYYSYVIQFCFFILVGAGKRTIYLIIYHILIMLFMWSFLQTVLKRHEPIPDEYHLSSVEHAKLITYSEEEANLILKKLVNLRKLEIYTCAPNTKIRYCKQCMLIKPDRTHHCSTCGKCILKMDHHCPWVYNCVGFSNYKQFLLMLLYSVIWCAFFVATVGEYLADIWKDFQSNLHKLQVGVGFLMAAFTGCLMAILLFYHVGLVCRNETTIEALHDVTFREDNMTFDAGKWYNFREVFGENVCCWLVPTHSGRGNGYEFPAKTSPV